MSTRAASGRQHGGMHHWVGQRISAVLLLPLIAWMLWAALALAGADFHEARAFLSQPPHAVMAVFTAMVMFYHAQAGIQVVCEDYVHPRWFQSALIWLTRAGCLAGVVATVYSIYSLFAGA